MKKNILIVDDDYDFQLLLTACLTQEGYECACVVSVKEALESVRFNTPDLVILDLVLKKASGIAFLQNFVRFISSGKKIPPVLVLSGYSDPEIISFTKTLGASRFIPKQLGTTEILLAVHASLHFTSSQ